MPLSAADPEVQRKLQEEADEVLGKYDPRAPGTVA